MPPKAWTHALEGSSSSGSSDDDDEAVKQEQQQPVQEEEDRPAGDDEKEGRGGDGAAEAPPNAQKRAPRADPAPAPIVAKKPKTTFTFEDLQAAGFRGGPSVLHMREGAFDPNKGVGTAWSDGRAERAAREAAAAAAAAGGDKDGGGGGVLNDAGAIRAQIEEDARHSRLHVQRRELERAGRGGRGRGRGRSGGRARGGGGDGDGGGS